MGRPRENGGRIARQQSLVSRSGLGSEKSSALTFQREGNTLTEWLGSGLGRSLFAEPITAMANHDMTLSQARSPFGSLLTEKKGRLKHYWLFNVQQQACASFVYKVNDGLRSGKSRVAVVLENSDEHDEMYGVHSSMDHSASARPTQCGEKRKRGA